MMYSDISRTIQEYSTGVQYAPWRAYITAITPNPTVSDTPYRPAEWNDQGRVKTFIENANGEQFIFDAILRYEHMNARRITEHPVQSGANISDHSFQLPAVLTMEIGMSDVMDNFNPSSWGGAETTPTKSVKAYQQIMEWKKSGEPLTIETRLETYANMVLETVSAIEDYKTKYGLRCLVNFKQIITAEVEETPAASDIKHVSETTNKAELSTKENPTSIRMFENRLSGV